MLNSNFLGFYVKFMVCFSISAMMLTCVLTCEINADTLVQWNTYFDGFQEWSHAVGSIGACATLCIRLTMCLSFNFDLSSNLCDLNSDLLENNTDRGMTKRSSVYSRIADWPETVIQESQ